MDVETKNHLRKISDLAPMLPKGSIAKLKLFASARIFSNLLDLIGVAGVGALALAINGFVSSKSSESSLNLPIVGEVVIEENQLILLAIFIVGVFILKSSVSILLRLRTALFVAGLESLLSAKLAKDFFSQEVQTSEGSQHSLSEFQNTAISSTEGISIFINSRISLAAETALLISIMTVFLIVNPLATLGTAIYMLMVLGSLNLMVRSRIKKRSTKKIMGSKLSLLHSKELFAIRKEARVAGILNVWLEKFEQSKRTAATSTAVISTLNSTPRYVIESALLLGVFSFLGAIYIFSDLGSQAVTLGVFMAGGLRLAALMVPLQASLNQMTEGASRGKFALAQLRQLNYHSSIEEAISPTRPLDGPLSLELDGVNFRFEGQPRLLHDISFSAKAGSKVAIVGPSGAGKSTLFELASGFRIPESGTVKLGTEAAASVLAMGRGFIGFVPQRSHLVSGTLASNVSLEPHEVTDLRKVTEVLKVAGLGKFASPMELEANIEPDSGALSGGEIQRLGLARALYRNPGILFLDESTSALDANTEAEVNVALDNLKGKVTIVIIAHRLSSVKNSDLILYLDIGRVVATGTFSELTKKVKDFRTAVELMGLD